jgi:hypothetical protein
MENVPNSSPIRLATVALFHAAIAVGGARAAD